MGASDFSNDGYGKTAHQAFHNVVDHAAWEHGHGGYTGTIAEKTAFVMVGKVKTNAEAYALADQLMRARDPRIDDKWGPAGCIEVEEGSVEGEDTHYYFFGWASS